MKKIVAYTDVPTLIHHLKKENRVLVGGCFDILHLGHVRFLNSAKKHGVLIVALEDDNNLKAYKGVSRPIHRQNERAEVLSSLEAVDYVILLPSFSTDAQYAHFTKLISPATICVTAGDPQLHNKAAQAKTVGATIITIPKIHTPSTSQLVKLLRLE